MDTERKPAALSIQRAAAERVIASGNGDAALLLLYLCGTERVLELSSAAKALGRTEAEIASAANALRGMGAFPKSAQALPQPEELPEYAAEEITRRCKEDTSFQALVGEAQRRLGHILSGAELKTLFGIYDHLGLSTDVIMMLINHCSETFAKRYGGGRNPTMRYIEREAFVWANRELVTMELAEAYLKRREQQEQGREQVRRAMGLTERALSTSEKRYIEEWLELGFSPEAIEIAYDRTVTNTGSLKWRYMDSIIRSWDAKGIHTPKEIERLDRRPGEKRGRSAEPSGSSQADLARMEKLLEKLSKE